MLLVFSSTKHHFIATRSNKIIRCFSSVMNIASKETLIQDCRYYKGEKDNPYAHKQSPSDLFCALEQQFVNNLLMDSSFLEDWINYSSVDFLQPILTKINNYDTFNATQKAIAAYIYTMIGKWSPMSVDDILKY